MKNYLYQIYNSLMEILNSTNGAILFVLGIIVCTILYAYGKIETYNYTLLIAIFGPLFLVFAYVMYNEHNGMTNEGA